MASYVQNLMTSQSDGTAVTAAARTTVLPSQAKYVFAPNAFYSIGQQIKIEAMGKMSSVITTPGTMRFDLAFGANVVFDGLAVLLDTAAAHANVGWWLEIFLTLRTVGSAATFMGHGKLTCEAVKGSGTMPLGSLVAMLPWNAAPAAGASFDSSASQSCDLFFTQTVATGSVTCQQFSILGLNY